MRELTLVSVNYTNAHVKGDFALVGLKRQKLIFTRLSVDE
ncbi:hypothetical protein SJAV_21590 [Sulfurisphaera javensis]|uniref:Uncharacterized protein n=1 Tax=Sulfurisphaera javensis TaxID=2049879 RepID=A0AAT9GUA6_9CREN